MPSWEEGVFVLDVAKEKWKTSKGTPTKKMTKSWVYEAHLDGVAKVVRKSWRVGQLGTAMNPVLFLGWSDDQMRRVSILCQTTN